MRRSFLIVLCAAAAACGSDVSPTPVCTYSVSATSMSLSAAGGSRSVTVTTQSECSWTARSDANWITIASGASGTGSSSVGVTVSPNTAVAARTSPLTIAGFTVTVSQEAASVTCENAVTADRTSFSKDGGTGTATVDTAGPCTWTAASDAPWLTITSGAEGTGSGVVSYSVARNFDIADRRAGLAIAARRLDIVQSGDTGGCQYSVAPVELNVCMSAPNELTTLITTQGSCPWTATAGAPWLTIVGGQSGTGSGSVRFSMSENWDAPARRSDPGAVADAHGRAERARLPGRLPVCGHALSDHAAGLGRLLQLRRAAAERAEYLRRTNAERVRLDCPG